MVNIKHFSGDTELTGVCYRDPKTIQNCNAKADRLACQALFVINRKIKAHPMPAPKRGGGPGKPKPSPKPKKPSSPQNKDRRTGGPVAPPPLPTSGPPPPYSGAYAAKVRQAAEIGLTITELARFLEVHIDVIHLWQMCYGDFAAAMRANTQARTDRVEAAFYQRAVGYNQPGEKIVSTLNRIVRVPIITHIPADPTAFVHWMKVHRPEQYGDKEPTPEPGTEPQIRSEDPNDASREYQRLIDDLE